MEHNEDAAQPKSDNDHEQATHREIVFVLRVRPGNTGWWGQVHRLDIGSLRYVAGHLELFNLLESDWTKAISDVSKPN